MASIKFYLKVYCITLGFVTSFASFLWLSLILYVLSRTDPNAADLIMARYLDISLGLLAFSSSLGLVYGAFVESKSWIAVWTLGSMTWIIGNWSWLFYRKYGLVTPEAVDENQKVLTYLSVAYVIVLLPVIKYYKLLENLRSTLQNDAGKWRVMSYFCNKTYHTEFESVEKLNAQTQNIVYFQGNF